MISPATYPAEPLPTPIHSQEVTPSQLWAGWLAPCKTATQAGYRADWEHFAGFLMRPVGEAPHESAWAYLCAGKGKAVASLQEYFGRLIEGGFAPSTVNRRVAAITSYVHAAHDMDVVNWTLPRPPKAQAEAYRDTRGPSLDTVAALIAGLEVSEAILDVRLLAVVRLLFDLGLRRAEVHAIRYPADLDFAGHRVRVMRKGKHEAEWRTCPLTTWEAIMAWTVRRGELDRCAPTWPGLLFGRRAESGWGWGPTAINTGLQDACKRFGLPHINPHALRHSSITTLASDKDVSLREVLAHSGHRDPRVVERYIDNVDDAAGRMAEKVSAALEDRRADKDA